MSQWSEPITLPLPDGGTAQVVASLATRAWERATHESLVEGVYVIDSRGCVTPEFIASLRQFIGKPWSAA